MLLALKLNDKSLAAETAPSVTQSKDQKRLVHLRWPSHRSLCGQRNVTHCAATLLRTARDR
jgi:hypothetical protein